MTGGRERDRYGHKDWREQLADIPAGIRAHPRVSFVAGIFVVGLAIQLLLRPTYVTVLEVAPGDCLYIRSGSTDADGPPVPDPTVEAFAERAACDASHSHEVLWIETIGEPDSPYPDVGALAARQARCLQSLSELRGGGADDGLVARLIAPTTNAWSAGARTGVCTVSRLDGGFLDRPLRDLPAGGGAAR